jgi:capsular polysaccharide transport system ATP-binding protein
MIRLNEVGKSYQTARKTVTVFDDLDLEIRDRRSVGVLGVKGSGKSTLLSLLCRREKPDRGSIQVDGSVSMPLATGLGLTHQLTGRENVKFIARLLGQPAEALIEQVQDMAQLGEEFDRAVGDYDNSCRQRLVFAVILAGEYDWYLADEKITVDDPEHRERFLGYFEGVKQRAGMVIASGNPGLLSKHCDSIVLLHGGSATLFDDVTTGIEQFRASADLEN